MDGDTQKLQLGKSVEFYRKALGLSQAQLAAALGKGAGQSHVSAIERGVNTPSVALLVELAEILKTDPNTLIGWGAVAEKTNAEATSETRFVVSAEGEPA